MKDQTDVLVDMLLFLYKAYLSMFSDTDIEMATFRKYLREEICDLYGIEENEWVIRRGDEKDGD